MSAMLPGHDAAWGNASKSEAAWPAAVAIILSAALTLFLPGRFTVGPPWLIPGIELAIVVALYVRAPRRLAHESKIHQVAAVVPVSVVTLANTVSLYLLVRLLLLQPKDVTGVQLLYSAVSIWVTNVLAFGVWFWELDRGGPDDRLRGDHGAPDFLFPQMTQPQCAVAGWSPKFFDYLYVSFTNATAFSPTDTMPLTVWAKSLMTVQSAVSLATIAIVASRAVNIIG